MKKRKSNYVLKKATEHIYYEVENFFFIISALKNRNSNNQIFINILLDSYVIHLRNLFNFLYSPKSIRNDDIICFDYIKKTKNIIV